MDTIAIDHDRLDQFVDFAWTLHANESDWIPPMREPLMRELSGNDALGRYTKRRLFLCQQDGQTTGRVAAIYNPRLVDSRSAVVGQLGHFEAIDDQQAAESLLEIAIAWLKSQGVRQVWGPMNGGVHRVHRFMTRGFERTPFVLEPRNPRYYPRLFTACGFQQIHSWQSFDMTVSDLLQFRERARLSEIAARVKKEFTLSSIDTKDVQLAVDRLYGILNEAWAGHFAYTPVDKDEFTELTAGMLLLLRRSGLNVAVKTTDPTVEIAMGWAFPDFAEEVRAIEGRAEMWGRWLQGKLPDRYVMHSVAVVPGYRLSGVAFLLVHRAIEVMLEEGYKEAVIALVTQDFGAFRKYAEPTREYAVYGRDVD